MTRLTFIDLSIVILCHDLKVNTHNLQDSHVLIFLFIRAFYEFYKFYKFKIEFYKSYGFRILTSVYEAVTYNWQEKCEEKGLDYQPLWFTYSVVIINLCLVTNNMNKSEDLK